MLRFFCAFFEMMYQIFVKWQDCETGGTCIYFNADFNCGRYCRMPAVFAEQMCGAILACIILDYLMFKTQHTTFVFSIQCNNNTSNRQGPSEFFIISL